MHLFLRGLGAGRFQWGGWRIIALSPESIGLLPAAEVINITQSATPHPYTHPTPRSDPHLPRRIDTELFVAVFQIQLHSPYS